ncbi:MAG: hypothetical protein ACJ72H_12655 [Candidatus Sulfotelmatobacter sp.]
MKVSFPVEAGNAAARNGTLGTKVKAILDELKPEAAYFVANERGERCGYVIFDMKEPSQIPSVAEPWFLAFNASITMTPTMTPQDLATAGPSIKRAVETYGSASNA